MSLSQVFLFQSLKASYPPNGASYVKRNQVDNTVLEFPEQQQKNHKAALLSLCFEAVMRMCVNNPRLR